MSEQKTSVAVFPSLPRQEDLNRDDALREKPSADMATYVPESLRRMFFQRHAAEICKEALLPARRGNDAHSAICISLEEQNGRADSQDTAEPLPIFPDELERLQISSPTVQKLRFPYKG